MAGADFLFLVLKGDIVGYSQVMNSELYEAVTRKLYEWAREICRDLMYVDVSGGDSILMIDGNAARILGCAKELVRRAGDFQEHPMKMRFGGAAGPIAFERLRRMHNGSWDTVTVPMGLALRTSALIEPHAPPNCAIVEERFHEFGCGRDIHADPEVPARLITALSRSDLPRVDYDRAGEKFVLRKNLLDPPYCTPLWRVNLD
jgi:hypothetical protein